MTLAHVEVAQEQLQQIYMASQEAVPSHNVASAVRFADHGTQLPCILGNGRLGKLTSWMAVYRQDEVCEDKPHPRGNRIRQQANNLLCLNCGRAKRKQNGAGVVSRM